MIRHIVALDSQRGMAKNGGIPWHTPTDVARYESLAFAPGSTLLTGYNTYVQSLRQLQNCPDCTAYVLTTHREPLPYAAVIRDVNAFLDSMRQTDVWIIGGASVFTQTLQLSDELYITEIEGDFNCDLFYPPYKDTFELVERSKPVVERGLRYTFCTYRAKE